MAKGKGGISPWLIGGVGIGALAGLVAVARSALPPTNQSPIYGVPPIISGPYNAINPNPSGGAQAQPATPGPALAKFPIIAQLWGATDAAFYNNHLLTSLGDGVQSGHPHEADLGSVTAATKIFAYTDPTQAAAANTNAATVPTTTLLLNDETTQVCATLASNLSSNYTTVTGAGNTLGYAPTRTALTNCIASTPSFVTLPNFAVLQGQGLQNTSTFASGISSVVGQMRSAGPKGKIYVQLSVNPPNDPSRDPGLVVDDIKTVMYTLEHPPDGIILFYLVSDIGRQAAAESVISYFRPFHA